MPRIRYVAKRFGQNSLYVIQQANEILEDYTAQGFRLTLRQLYYQFVSKSLIPNKMSEYKKLGSIVNDARLAGLIDWSHIEDRTRSLESIAHFDTPDDIIEVAANQYRNDLWADQPHRLEVWIEKDALVGVIEHACKDMDVAFLSCRGYTSQSEMWGASQRLLKYIEAGQKPVIIHLGDHDPSGKDMTRDIRDRLFTFIGSHLAGEPEYGGTINFEQYSAIMNVKRIALNWDQIQQYEPPPNPAKITDTRARKYIDEFGLESWELDALEPTVIDGLIRGEIESHIDWEKWDDAKARERKDRDHLEEVSRRWDEVEEMIES